MIHIVDRSLERFLRERVPLPETSISVSFDAPDRSWGAGLTRPTVNVFLWDITPSPHTSQAVDQRVRADGRLEERWFNPRVDLHYLVTAWASEVADEHQLLGRVATTLMSHPAIPAEHLVETPYEMQCAIRMDGELRQRPGEFWSALGGRLKPGVQVVVAVPVEAFQWWLRGPEVETVEVRSRPASVALDEQVIGGAALTATEPLNAPGLRRQRRNGSLVMEGKPANGSDDES